MELHVSTWINLTDRMSRGKKLQKNPYGLPGWCSGKEFTRQCRRWKRHRVQFLRQEDPWRRKQQLTSIFLLGELQGQRSLVGYGPQGCKESDKTEHTWTHAVWIHYMVSKPRKTYYLLFGDVCKYISTLLTGNVLIRLLLPEHYWSET